MSNQREKVEKTRVSVTMTRSYLDALDRLVAEGVYLSRGEAVLEGLRIIFRLYKFESFWVPEGPSEEGGEEAGRRG